MSEQEIRAATEAGYRASEQHQSAPAGGDPQPSDVVLQPPPLAPPEGMDQVGQP